jgi:phage/plasmid-associated DNA primase
MGHALGEYKGTVPSTLVTGRRPGLGGTCSEVIQLKGIRYAVMQELSKGEGLNEGVMKELTGGDPITARALYSEAETFIPQFGLVVCTNTLPEIRSNDDGTWRRIRICPFNAKFVDDFVEWSAPSADDDIPLEEKVHIFPKDKNLKKKLPLWAPVFMGMLVHRVFQTKGHVEDCDIVLLYSNRYRQGQDNISAFVNETIRKKTGSKIKLQELVQQFKIWNDTKVLPKGAKEEIQLFMDKKFGRRKTGDAWHNVEIIYPDAETEEIADFI